MHNFLLKMFTSQSLNCNKDNNERRHSPEISCLVHFRKGIGKCMYRVRFESHDKVGL